MAMAGSHTNITFFEHHLAADLILDQVTCRHLSRVQGAGSVDEEQTLAVVVASCAFEKTCLRMLAVAILAEAGHWSMELK